MVTLQPDAMLIAISTPYRTAGLLYRKYRDHYGKGGDDVLVIKAPSRTLNPIDQADIDAALAEDPAHAAAEWLAEFRDDIAGWATRELIEQSVDRDVTVRAPQPNIQYFSFVDSSGGVRDSYCAATAHDENGVAVLDCLVEIRAPFNPDSATARIADMLKSYRCHSTVGDKYSAQWIVAAFERCGITYRHSDRDRSAIYLDALPLFTTGRARLLDSKRLVTQPPRRPLSRNFYDGIASVLCVRACAEHRSHGTPIAPSDRHPALIVGVHKYSTCSRACYPPIAVDAQGNHFRLGSLNSSACECAPRYNEVPRDP
jgi:hypothetical protein